MSTFTPNKDLELPAHNSDIDSWDAPLNSNFTLIDTALGSSVALNATALSGTQTLVTASYQALTLVVGGAPSGAITYQVPASVGGFWVFVNNTTGGQTVGIASAAGGATITVGAGANTIVTCDGSASGMRLAVNVPSAAAGSNTQIQYNSGGTLAGSANLVFDGTTLSVTGLSVGGSTTLGNSSGNNLQLLGSTITIPNGLNIASNNLVLNGTDVAIGTSSFFSGALLTVAGNIKITTGGLQFSDGSQLLSASSLAPAGSNGNVQYNNGSGGFAADSVFTYNSGTHTLSLTGLSVSGTSALTTLTVANPVTALSVTGLIATNASITNLTVSTLVAGSPWTGMVNWWPGPVTSIPAVALQCNGAAISRTTYAALFAAIGTTWGVGDGSTTFNLPDLRGYVLAGADGGTNVLANGTTGGFTSTANIGQRAGEKSHTLTAAQQASMSVSGTATMPSNDASGGGPTLGPPTAGTGNAEPNFTGSISGTAAGGGGAHNNVQPTAVGTWVIFT